MRLENRLATQLCLWLTCVCLVGCTNSSSSSKPGAGEASTTSATSGSANADSAVTPIKLQGSGASFPAPLYQRWFKTYSSSQPNVKVDYQSKGSGAGIKDFTSKTVDFAASDAAMTDEEIGQVEGGVVLLPLTAGKIVLAYNLPGVDKLKLSREVYANIYLGKITKWNDPAIAKENLNTNLPDLQITVATRSDSSGTTFVLTQHLSAISADWKNGPGTGKTVNWPAGAKIVAAPKNDGVTATIKQTPGAIGYIEYGFAQQTKLAMAELQNKAGQYVAPNMESGKAALAAVEMPADLRAWLPDPAGDASYPIVTYTWLLCYKNGDKTKSAALKNLVKYCLTEGQKVSAEMGFIPLPESVVEAVNKALDTIQ